MEGEEMMEKAQTLSALEELSSRAILEFDELQKNCNKFYTKYSQEHDQNQKLQSQFKQLKRVSLLAVTEYENLMKRFTDEAKIKEEIESKLKKVEEENRELRKSKNISPNVAIIPAQTAMGGADGATKGELEGLKGLLSGMKEEIRRTKSDVSRLENQLADEKREHEATQQKLRIGNAQIQQLNRVSVMALDEFQELRKKYELEVACRRKAEEYASQLLHNQQSELRTSQIVNESLPLDSKLDNALKEIEELNKTLAKERSLHEQNVKNLNEELESSKDTQNVKALEDKMSVALDQIELLQSQLQASEERGRQSEYRVQELNSKLVHAEAAVLAGGSALPVVPPPPPPPPPPLMPAPVIRKFITRIGAGKKKRDEKAPEKDDPIQDMMKEMMARIKDGGLLRSKMQINKEKSPAMNELADLLTNLKRGQSGSDKKTDVADKKEPVPEFQQLKLRKVSAKAEPPKVAVKKPKKDSELMKKLDKQRLASEDVENDDNAERQSTEGHMDSKPEGPPLDDSQVHVEGNSSATTELEAELKQDTKNASPETEEQLNAESESNQAKPGEEMSDENTNEVEYVNVARKIVSSTNERADSREKSDATIEEARQEDSGESSKNVIIANENKKTVPSTVPNETIDKSFDEIFDEINEFLDK